MLVAAGARRAPKRREKLVKTACYVSSFSVSRGLINVKQGILRASVVNAKMSDKLRFVACQRQTEVCRTLPRFPEYNAFCYSSLNP